MKAFDLRGLNYIHEGFQGPLGGGVSVMGIVAFRCLYQSPTMCANHPLLF